MAKVFKKGDIVYNPRYGEVTVVLAGQESCEVQPRIGTSRYAYNDLLSFTPWPAPCHERPFTEVGWWVGKSKSTGCPLIRWRESEKSHKFDEKSKTTLTSEYIDWVKFLGKEIE